jgi:hypothetical protein
MNLATDLTSLLQQYGGWGIAAIVILGLVYFYKDFKKTVNCKDQKFENLYQKYLESTEQHHKEMINVVTECTGVLVTVNDSLKKCELRQELLKHD